MAKKNDCWGIEVGSNAIKAIHLQRSSSEVELVEFDVLPFKQILTTPDLNIDQAIQVNLEQFMQRHEMAGSTVVVSVAGHMAFARFAKLPPVDPKKIPDIVKFEAVQQIPFPIEQVEWDYHVFEKADSPDVEVGIFAIMRDRVLTFLRNYQTAGLPVDGVTLSPLAVYNAMAYDMEFGRDSPGTIFVDIGTTSTDVIVAEEGRTWLRTLPLGGNNFTEALVQSFKLSFPKAEKLKREATTSKYARQIYVAMRPVFADLVQEVQRSLGYYQSLRRDASLTQIVGLGSTFRLPGLRKFLKQQLQMEVIRPDGFKRIGVDETRTSEFSRHVLNLATAYGLALQGLGLERVNANLLPTQIVKQRMWRSKQSWFAGAAAALVVAAGLAGFRQFSDRSSFTQQHAEFQPTYLKTIKRAEAFKKQWDEIQITDTRQQIENLQRIPDYREVWPLLLTDIQQALDLHPQEALLKPDFEAIKAIPRSKRRRVAIDSVTSEYIFSYSGRAAPAGGDGNRPRKRAAAKASIAIPSAPTSNYDEIFGARDTVAKTASDDDDFDFDDGLGETIKPPAFVITIRGTIPLNDGQIALERALADWFGHERPRPYKISPWQGRGYGVQYIRHVTQSGAGDGRRRAGGQNEARGRGQRQPPRDRRAALRRERGRGGLAGAESRSWDHLLPQNPLADEPRRNDWEFEIKWQVELLRPDVARASEQLIQAVEPGQKAREDRS